MDLEHEAVQELLGAFVLGQLPQQEHDGVNAHLRTCDDCRSEVAALLAVVGPLSYIDPDDPMPSPPAGLDARITAALAQGQEGAPSISRTTAGRRWLPVAVSSALAGAAATIGVVVLIGDDAAQPVSVTPEAVEIVREAPGIDATAGVIDHSWGMEINLVGSGFSADASYDVVVTDRNGRSFTSGAFVGVGDNTLTCEMNSAVLRDRAVSFVVVADDGTVVVRADLA